MAKRIIYEYDDHNFDNFRVVVKSSSGLLDLPELKTRPSYDWSEMNGKVVDTTSRQHYNARTITLSCTLYASSMAEFLTNLRSFQQIFMHTGKKLLKITLPSQSINSLIYLVYPSSGIKVTKQWSLSAMFGTFDLTFEEPEPLKSVYVPTMDAVSLITTFAKKGDTINVYWGDGQETLDITAINDNEQRTITHNYLSRSTSDKYIVITGDVEHITINPTNATQLWNLL